MDLAEALKLLAASVGEHGDFDVHRAGEHMIVRFALSADQTIRLVKLLAEHPEVFRG